MIFVNNNVAGADVSFYQDNNLTPQQIDFSKMVGQNASFVIIRGGQNVWIDPDFSYNWQKAREAGLPRGSYWFYDSRISPERQAELFASLFSSDKPELRLWVDLEENYGGPYSGFANWKKFILRLQQLLPDIRIGIYTSYGYIRGKIPLAEYAFFSQFPLWIAWYNAGSADVIIPLPWTVCEFWQWGTPAWGTLWGCESIEIDMNLFNGTKSDFNNRFGLNLPPGGTMNKYRVTNAAGLNLRPATGTNNTVIKNIAVSSYVWGTDLGNSWLKITHYQQPTEQYATPLDCYGYKPLVAQVEYTDPPVQPPAKVALVSGGLNYDIATGELTATAKYEDGSVLTNIYPKEK